MSIRIRSRCGATRYKNPGGIMVAVVTVQTTGMNKYTNVYRTTASCRCHQLYNGHHMAHPSTFITLLMPTGINQSNPRQPFNTNTIKGKHRRSRKLFRTENVILENPAAKRIQFSNDRSDVCLMLRMATFHNNQIQREQSFSCRDRREKITAAADRYERFSVPVASAVPEKW